MNSCAALFSSEYLSSLSLVRLGSVYSLSLSGFDSVRILLYYTLEMIGQHQEKNYHGQLKEKKLL